MKKYLDEKDSKTEKIQVFEQVMVQLKKALNTNGWDGRWFKRAFMDDGNVLGSMENDECRIDSIAQRVEYFHSRGYKNRGIKPGNFLIEKI